LAGWRTWSAIFIRSRTAEGRSRAKARGQHIGRPAKLTPQQQKEVRRRRAEGETLKELGHAGVQPKR
jgi:DNA invertase Pin-like site-specific DNA recombinase